MKTTFKVFEELQTDDMGGDMIVFQVCSTYMSASGHEISVFVAECDDRVWADRIADMLNTKNEVTES